MTEAADNRAGDGLDQGFLLDGLTVSPPEGSVTGLAGQEKLDPKVMDVLVMLAEHAGRVVLREDLLAKLWPGAVVTDDALSRCIYELRRQLAQAGGDEQLKALIETVPKRGYRLNAEVAPLLAPEVAAPSQPSRIRLWLALAAIPVAALLWFGGRGLLAPDAVTAYSIAILPFEDMSASKDQGYLADGIAEEVLNRLTSAGNLRVIARRSSFSFRGAEADITDIARRLKVSHVLEGSVRRSGDRIRITAQLIAAADNSQVWSETYDRKLGDLFAIQDEIAASVASALSSRLAGGDRAEPVAHDAYEAFLKGESLYNRRAPGDVAQAAKYYQDALVIEPGFARAWAALAGAYSLMAYEGDIATDYGRQKQGEAARKAVELDPNHAMSQARLAQFFWDSGDRRKSYEVWDRARALNPDEPTVLSFAAGLAMRAGDAEKAVETQRRLVARDPVHATYHVNLGMFLQAIDRLEDAKAELREALVLNPGIGAGVELAIGRILVLQKRYDDAAAVFARLPEGAERDYGQALLAYATGDLAQADALLARLVDESDQTPDIPLAEVYAFRGMTEAAFAELESIRGAVARDEPAMASQLWSWQVELRVSPFLRPLHADPRWAGLVFEPH